MVDIRLTVQWDILLRIDQYKWKQVQTSADINLLTKFIYSNQKRGGLRKDRNKDKGERQSECTEK